MDVDVIKCDVWEFGIFLLGVVLYYVFYEFKFIKVVGCGQECVQQEQLFDGVCYVQDFDEKVYGCKVLFGLFVVEEVEELGGLVFGVDEYVLFVFFVGVQLFVYEFCESIERFVFVFRGVVLGFFCEVNVFVYV